MFRFHHLSKKYAIDIATLMMLQNTFENMFISPVISSWINAKYPKLLPKGTLVKDQKIVTINETSMIVKEKYQTN